MRVRLALTGFLTLSTAVACGDSREFTVGVTRPLQVISISPSGDFPAGGADNVARDALVAVVFSDNVVESTVTGGGITLLNGSDTVESVITYDAESFTATLAPASPLTFSTVYHIVVDRTVIRVDDEAVLAQEIDQYFKTEDPPSLAISSVLPGHGSTSTGLIVDSDGNTQSLGNRVALPVTATFSEGLNSGSINEATFSLVRVTDQSVLPATITLSSSDAAFANEFGEPLRTNDIATLVSDELLHLSTEYELQVSSGVDLLRSARATTEGGWIEPGFQAFTLRTPDPNPLSLLAALPGAGSRGIGNVVYFDGVSSVAAGEASIFGNRVSREVTIVFSESVSIQSFAANVQILEADNDGVAGALTVSGSWVATASDGSTLPWRRTDTWTFSPSEPWNLSANYVLRIGADLESWRATATGGRIGINLDLDWESRHPRDFVVTNVWPSDGSTNVGTLRYYDSTTAIAVAPVTSYVLTQFGNYATAPVVVRFSESVDRQSAIDGITVFPADEFGNATTITPINTILVFSGSGSQAWSATDVVTIVPDHNADGIEDFWELSGDYLVVIDGSVKSYRATSEDLGGILAGELNNDTTIHFEIAHPAGLLVNSNVPSTDGTNVGILTPDLFGNSATFETVIKFSERLSATSLPAIRILDVTSGTDLTSGFTVSFENSGIDPWLNDDIIRIANSGSLMDIDLSRNVRVHVPDSVKSYRATSESGWLPSDLVVDWDVADPLPLFLDRTSPGDQVELSDAELNDWSIAGYSSVSPGDGVSGFTIDLVFSEPVDPASLAANLVVYENGLLPVAGAISYSGGNTTATFTSASVLGLSSSYSVELTGGNLLMPFAGVASVRGVNVQDWYDPADDYGGYLDGDHNVIFSTPDPADIILSGITPPVDVTGYTDNITRGVSISVQFSEPLSSSVVSSPGSYVRLVNTDDASVVAATYTMASSNRRIVIDPVAELDFSTVYRLDLETGGPIRSWRANASGGDYDGSNAFYFKTLDPAVLTIWATSPSDTEDGFGISVSDVGITGQLQIVFNEPIVRSTFESSFQMESCGASSAGCELDDPAAPSDPVTGLAFSYAFSDQKVNIDAGVLNYNTYYQFKVTGGSTGVLSVSAATNCSSSCEDGFLPTDYLVLFRTREAPPLDVDSVTPVEGSTGNPIDTPVIVQFSADVSVGTLTGSSFFVTDVSNNQLVHRFGDATTDAFYSSGFTAQMVLPTNALQFDTQYDIVALSSIRSTDGRFLATDRRMTFRTKLASLLSRTDPDDGEKNVEVTLQNRPENAGSITVVFDQAVTLESVATLDSALQVTYETARGVVKLTGEFVTTATEWQFIPDSFCTPATTPLELNATYYARLDNTVWAADGSAQLGSVFNWTFDTSSDPKLAAIEATSGVPGLPDLEIDLVNDTDSQNGEGADDVPIGSWIEISFSRAMDGATIDWTVPADPDNDTLRVVRYDGSYMDLFNVTVNSDDIRFQVEDPDYADILAGGNMAFSTTYTIELDEIIADTSGNPLDGDYELTFKTSVAPRAWLLPAAGDGNNKDQKYAPSITFSTEMVATSIDDSNLYLCEGSGTCTTFVPSLLDFGEDLFSAALIPTPIMAASTGHTFFLVVGADGPRDRRGNPVPGAPVGTNYTKQFGSTANDNGTTTLSWTARYPASGGSAAGGGPISLVLTESNTIADVMATRVDQSSFWVFYDAGHALPVTGRVYYDQVTGAAVFVPADGVYFNAGQTYFVENNSSLASSIRNECTNCADYTFVGESVAPTVAGIAPAGAAEPATTNIVVTFSEPVRPASLSAGVTVEDSGSNAVAGSWRTLGRRAIFDPDDPVRGGETYTVSVLATVVDLAGNASGTSSQSFTIESGAPSVVSIDPADASGYATTFSTVTVTFDEDVSPGSVTASLPGVSATIPGSVRLTLNGVVDPLDPLDVTNMAAEVSTCTYVRDNVVEIVPLQGLADATTYALGISSWVTDLGGTALGVPSSTSFTTVP